MAGPYQKLQYVASLILVTDAPISTSICRSALFTFKVTSVGFTLSLGTLNKQGISGVCEHFVHKMLSPIWSWLFVTGGVWMLWCISLMLTAAYDVSSFAAVVAL